jgi:DnaJ-class molecular chaperone
MPNYYDTLGVQVSVSADEIKKAYRKLASQHHPDRGGDTAKFQEIQAAYDVLGSAEKRQQYDLSLSNAGRQQAGGFGFGFGGFQDFSDFFRQAHQQAQAQPRRNRDLRIKIIIELAETLVETEKTISVKTTQNTRDTVVVKLPAGITAGSVVKYSGLGDNFFENLPRGDLYVYIDIKQHADFQVLGADLETHVRISCFEAILGCEKIITSLENTQLCVKIPSGTQPNSVLVLKNQGLVVHGSEFRGALRVKVQVEIPRSLSDQQLEQIKQLTQEIKNDLS